MLTSLSLGLAEMITKEKVLGLCTKVSFLRSALGSTTIWIELSRWRRQMLESPALCRTRIGSRVDSTKQYILGISIQKCTCLDKYEDRVL